MRGGVLALGLILLIFGILFYFIGNNLVQEVEAYDVEGIPISEILKLDSGVRAKYDTGKSLVMFGSIFGIVGFILCIAGIAAPSKKRGDKDDLSKKMPTSVLGEVIGEFKEKNRKSSQAECEICGKLKDTRELEVTNVGSNELYLCEKCRKLNEKKTEKTNAGDNEPVKILKLRYAKGEITKEEFEQMKKDLE